NGISKIIETTGSKKLELHIDSEIITDKSENRKSIDRELAETRRKLYETQLKPTQAEKGDEIKIKELEVEKEELKNRNEELNSFIRNLEGMIKDDLKSQTVQSHQQIAENIETSKQHIKRQHETIDNYKSREDAIEAEKNAEEIFRLKQSNEEARQRAAKKMNLITSAWFSMGRRIQGDHVFLQRQGPTSFLYQQRVILDTQLKRRWLDASKDKQSQ
ncbi:4346_t:CDS:2, partial [Racocetra persica]